MSEVTSEADSLRIDASLSPRSRLAMVAILLSIALAVLDTAIANTALPSIAEALDTGPAASVWIINAYQLAAVATLLPLAALGGVIGHRRVYIAGLLLFTIASAACSLSGSLSELTISRVLQGLGASAIMSGNTALIAAIYPAKTLARGFGMNALVVGIAFAVGPTVASVVLSLGPWPWLFAINIPIGIVALAFAFATLPSSERPTYRFDIWAAALTTIAFAALILGLSDAAQGTAWVRATAALAVFAITATVLIRYEAGSPAPMLPVDLLKRPMFALSALTAFCAFAAQGLAFVSLPFFLQHSLGLSEITTGFIMTPWSAVVAVMAPIAGRLCERFASGLLGAIGLAVMSGGLALLAAAPANGNLMLIELCMVICGAGFGFFQSPNQKALMSSAPRNRSGGASGVVATARLIGQAVGAALVALCFGVAGDQGPTVALVLGSVFAGVGCIASASRLFTR
ncbi:MFS transporter [Rhizobium sp. 16-449-1b]|uniref:MFS transporter n=1 Tax=Rhizobium sp. 16-449-1b TaxID=2819989 RepID=UPI001ADC33AF|nr:MFS transporter [Rhizobium sp. 16-449-1b]MBO9198604.1 MFS transporter [Rhizobium sp. 16-449-1b]